MRWPFLTAQWESLVLLNFRCPADLLEPLVPRGTILDRWKGEALVSLVGFRFAGTRVRGISIPFHRTFEEVNLRFYVRRSAPDGTERRAVVFIRELVPRRAIAAVARWMYNEPYLAVPMGHTVNLDPVSGGDAVYTWTHSSIPFTLRAHVEGPATPVAHDSEAAFITEHYWGYTRQRDGRTLEYQVEHPSWLVWQAQEAAFDGSSKKLYGQAFAEILSCPPQSAFVAVGSAVAVHVGERLVNGDGALQR